MDGLAMESAASDLSYFPFNKNLFNKNVLFHDTVVCYDFAASMIDG
jgi:hypothetical protein